MDTFVAELSKIISDEGMIDYLKEVFESSETKEDFTDIASPIISDLTDGEKSEDEINSICEKLFSLKDGSTAEEEKPESNVNINMQSMMRENSSEIDLMNQINKLKNPLEQERPILFEEKETSKSLERSKKKEEEKRKKFQQERFDAIESEYAQFKKGPQFRRPHRETAEIHEIHLKEINVSIGPVQLLHDAELILAPGNRYGLVGRNGMGKTTFMRHINSRLLGNLDDMLVIHVEQEAPISERSVLESVLDCDVERTELLERMREIDEKHDATVDEIQEIQDRLTAIGAHSAEAKVTQLLISLGFTPEQIRGPLSACSGGFRMRVSLAQALYIGPDVLMLDEPTGHLDAPSVCWLEEFLTTQCKSQILLVISHDRVFLDNVCTHIVHLKDQKLTTYRGNYSAFAEQFEHKLADLERQRASQEAFIEKQEDYVRRFRYKAWAAAQAQGRLKLIEKEKAKLAETIERDPPIAFKFELTSEAAQNDLITCEDVKFAYTPDHPIFDRLNIKIMKNSRIIIIGANGSGKSTFIKILMGENKPTDGFFQVISNLRIGYFSQHHIDQMNYNDTPLQFMIDRHGNEFKPDQLRGKLGEFGIGTDQALRPIGSLSGGQKTKVVLASISIINPHLIILDEVTNNLDMDSIEALGKALGEYRGAIVAITHDQHFAELIGGQIYVFENMDLKPFKGTFAEFRKQIKTRIKSEFLKSFQA